MTSPAQLKYLDALDIPIWVSRDLVVLESSSTETVKTTAESNKQQPSAKLSGADSVDQILQGLNQQANPAINTPAPAERTEPANSPARAVAPADTEKTENEVARTASHIVYACGSQQADWMVIGESPELNDSRLNQPYDGESGVLLSNMLRAVGLDNPRESAYLVNVIKSNMQAVDPASVSELNKFLNDMINKVKPKIVLLVGQLAAQNLLESKEPLARLRGKPQKHAESGAGIIISYYPSYLLSKPMDKRKAWDDLKLAMKQISLSAE